MANAQITYLIIGNGIAGITAAETLRTQDPSAAITIVADDPSPVYYRPALKDYLAAQMPEEKLWARPVSFYHEQRIGFITGRVTGINPGQRSVQLYSGQQLNYQMLLLAQGAHARRLECPGTDLAGVSTLRVVADYQQILRHLEKNTHVVICGSGTLALESAEVLQQRGCQVTHLLRGSTLWSDVLDPAASDLVLHEERRAGIDIRLYEEITEIVGKKGKVNSVITTSGAHIPCELVLIAIGIQPNLDFIQASGIAHRQGIQVDQHMRTSAPSIYAAGDVVETTDTVTGQTRLLGQWYPAIQQARTAAYNMHATLHALPNTIPDSWSHEYHNYYNATFLYGLDFVSIGQITAPQKPVDPLYQEIIAPPEPRNYRKVLLKHGIIVGALFLGARQQAMTFKRAIDHHINVTTIINQLFTPTLDFAGWLDKQQVPPALIALEQQKNSALPADSLPPGIRQRKERLPHSALTPVEGQSTQEAVLVPISHPKVHVQLREFVLQQEKQISIGRHEQTDLLIDHSSISRQHAEIEYTDGSYVLRDKGSSNGTFVNNLALGVGRAHSLHQNDRIRLGDVQFRFEWRQGTFQHIQGSQLHTNAMRRIPASVLATLPPTPTLVLMGQTAKPVMVPLTFDKRTSIGRNPQNDISLADTATSQVHAELFPTQDGFYIRDLNSRNGVFINKIKINNAYNLSHGDSIVIGNMFLYYSFPQSLPQHPAKNTYRLPALQIVPDKKNLLPALHVVPGLSHRPTVQSLSTEHVRFEIDMCIGCDRCMVACPLPISTTVMIADLNQATVNETVSPHVTQFTQDCIMCGSCVSVCPVDNHRDLLMLSLKQRLGASWESPANTQHVADMLPKGWSIPQLLQRLRMQVILKNPQEVSENYLLHLINASRFLTLQPGETVIHEGEYGRDLYLIIEGRLNLLARGGDKNEFPVAVLNPGEYVGEDGMLTGQRYNATAKVQTTALILQVPDQVMQHLMDLVPQERAYFDQTNNGRSLHAILKRMSLFQGIADTDISAVIREAQVKQYDRDERIFTERDSSAGNRPARETLHILLEGFVKVAHAQPENQTDSTERIMAYRQGGDYFVGGLDLLGDGKAVTVTTINRVRVAEIPRQTMLALLQHYPEVKQRFSQRLREYVETAIVTQISLPAIDLSKKRTKRLPEIPIRSGLQSLVSYGVVEGTEVLVIDLDKCIHCNECEDACERRHGHSRMNRKGKVIGNISITTTCRQCQDPVCMLCSRAGIARLANGEVYITESCIGCGICAERCPYGAISIVDSTGERDHPSEQASWQMFSSFFAKGTPKKQQPRKNLPMLHQGNQVAPGPLENPPRDAYNDLRKKIAIKCDLCAGYNNQACVDACPTGAAIRIQPGAFFGSTEQILQHS